MDWVSKDLSASFRTFKKHAEFMFKGPLSGKTEDVRCNYLMLWVGDKGRHIYITLTLQRNWTLNNTETFSKALKIVFNMKLVSQK